jgi:hypothetical protein
LIRSDGSAATTGAHCDLLPDFLRAAVRALVVLYVVCFGGGDPHALAVEPPLAYVAADPEFVCIVETAAGSTKGFVVIFIVVILFRRGRCPRLLCVAITSPL